MRENKKYFSRTWLIIVNVLAFLSSLVIVALGIMVVIASSNASKTISGADSEEAKKAQENVYTFLKITGAIVGVLLFLLDGTLLNHLHPPQQLAVYGFFVLLTSVFGIVGACTRNSGILSCYIGTVAVSLVFTIAGMIYTLVTLSKKKNDWSNMTLDTWKAYDDYERYLYQFQFQCCGFNMVDGKRTAVYTGIPSAFQSVGYDYSCSTTVDSSIAVCQEAAVEYFRKASISQGVVSAIAALLLVTCIGAAVQARKSFSMDGAAQPMMAKA
ncbi:hypothetical protein HDU96_008284 [Phlyctochytrium bullatum]|nr:hypothetical protein HDU96_008284 [Phlyctochytrium bullatum]